MAIKPILQVFLSKKRQKDEKIGQNNRDSFEKFKNFPKFSKSLLKLVPAITCKPFF
jgi:hypothetical protein